MTNSESKAYMGSLKKYMVCSKNTGEHLFTIVTTNGKKEAYKRARAKATEPVIITKVAAYTDTTRGQW